MVTGDKTPRANEYAVSYSVTTLGRATVTELVTD